MIEAAVIVEIGTAPTTKTLPLPVADADDEVLLDVLAVAFNPVDVAIGSGRFYAGHPPLPYVPGIECVGRTTKQRLVYAQGSGRGISLDGFTAEQVVAPSASLIDLPDETDPVLAVALGTAGVAGWLGVTARGQAGPDDVVVVLGATGSVGRIALQAAHIAGARQVVAVARSAERLAQLGGLADATVAIDGDDLSGRIGAACAQPPTLVIDALWGAPAVAAMTSAAPGARIVQLGASTGPEAMVPSAPVRGKQLDILGYSNFGVPRQAFVDGYRELVDLANAGRVTLPIERFALSDVAAAWDAAANGRSKAVVTMQSEAGKGAR
jgi:NADPH2:quinone reductase